MIPQTTRLFSHWSIPLNLCSWAWSLFKSMRTQHWSPPSLRLQLSPSTFVPSLSISPWKQGMVWCTMEPPLWTITARIWTNLRSPVLWIVCKWVYALNPPVSVPPVLRFFLTVLRNRTLTILYGSDFWQVPVPVPAPALYLDYKSTKKKFVQKLAFLMLIEAAVLPRTRNLLNEGAQIRYLHNFILCLCELLWFHFIMVPGSGSGKAKSYGS